MYDDLLNAIRTNRMQACFFNDEKQAVEYVRSRLKKGCTVASGGSITLKQCGITDLLHCGDYTYSDRAEAQTQEQAQELMHKAFNCNAYFCSANAITMDGTLYNVDGNANRISALTYGPEEVFVIAGKNKIVNTLDDAVYRVKTVSAPLNAKRLNCDTPCAKTGKCISLGKQHPSMYDGCRSKDRICCSYVITGQQRIKDRITVIIINKELGL